MIIISLKFSSGKESVNVNIAMVDRVDDDDDEEMEYDEWNRKRTNLLFVDAIATWKIVKIQVASFCWSVRASRCILIVAQNV